MAGLYVDLSYICAHIPSRYTGLGCVGSLSPDNMIAKPLPWTLYISSWPSSVNKKLNGRSFHQKKERDLMHSGKDYLEIIS